MVCSGQRRSHDFPSYFSNTFLLLYPRLYCSWESKDLWISVWNTAMCLLKETWEQVSVAKSAYPCLLAVSYPCSEGPMLRHNPILSVNSRKSELTHSSLKGNTCVSFVDTSNLERWINSLFRRRQNLLPGLLLNHCGLEKLYQFHYFLGCKIKKWNDLRFLQC